jgi:drug/metabolite transporter (DMT)-like permease
VPLFVLTIAHFLIPGGRLTRWRVVGFVIGFSGVILIIGPDAIGGIKSPAALWGAIATLGAAMSYAISAIYTRRLGPGDPVCRAAGVLIISSMLAMPAAFVAVPDIVMPGVVAVMSLAVLGMIATGFATILCFRLIQGPGPAFLSLVNYLVPAWAVLAGIVLLGESISRTVMYGLVLILFGTALSEFGARIGPMLRSAGNHRLPHPLHLKALLGLVVVLVGGCTA